MTYITKKYTFCAAHRYWNEKWDEERNYQAFGDDIKNHGHNYTLSITIKGPINQDTGFIICLKKLNLIVNKNVINILDHSQIENDIKWFKDKQPSTENMVIFIWDQIVDLIPEPSSLYCVKLQETPTIYTEYFGEEHNG